MTVSARKLIKERSQGDAEVLDKTPIEIPVSKTVTLREELHAFVKQELSRQIAEKELAGSFEEEDDFTEEDPDPDWLSPYEVQDMQEEVPAGEIGHTLDGTPNQEDVEQTAVEANTPTEAKAESAEVAENHPND